MQKSMARRKTKSNLLSRVQRRKQVLKGSVKLFGAQLVLGE